MSERFTDLWRLAGWLVGMAAIMAVVGGGVYTITQLYSVPFRMASLSHSDSLIAALTVVVTAGVTLFIPESLLSRFIFGAISLSIFGGIMTALAPTTGLMTLSPPLWGVIGNLSISVGVGAFLPTAWVAVTKAKAAGFLPKVAEDDRKLPKVERKSSLEGKDRKRLSVRKSPKVFANPDSGAMEDMTKLLETLSVYIDNKGNMAATARQLGLTPPGVGDRLRRLYELEPERVMRDAPEWVKRNIKE